MSVIQNFYHRGSLGDIIYSLPTIYSYKTECNLYLRTKEHREFLYSLLVKQEYIKDVFCKNKNIEFINLNGFVEIALKKRSQHLVVSHLESLNREYDFSKKWLKCKKTKYVADIVINRTLHYHDKEEIDWTILKDFNRYCIFIGEKKEYEKFIKKYKVNIKFYEIKDALEVAELICGSKLFIGNQSCFYSIAEALKKPRCLEVFSYYDNCRPTGKNGYTYLDKNLIKKYLD